MTKFKDIIITATGQNAINQAIASGGKITYTKASLSATDLTSKSISDIQAITALDNQKDSTLTLISAENGSVVLSATFDNAGLANDIKFNSVGWFAKTDQQAEFLFAVSRYDTEQVLGTIAPDSDATQSITLQIGLAVSQGNVQVVETQAGVAMKADLNKAVINLTDSINLLNDTKADKSEVNTALAKKADQSNVDNQINTVTKSVSDLSDTVKSNQTIINEQIDTKADKTDVGLRLATKANQSDLDNTNNEVAKKADSDDVEKELAKKANSFDVTNSIKQLTDTVNAKVDQSAVDNAVKPISDALNTKANTADVNNKLSTKITFVKCSSPQEAHDISSKPADDGSVVVGIYDMDDEPSKAIVGDKKVTISTLYDALNSLQTQVTGLSGLQALIDGKADKATVDAEIAKIDFTPYAKKADVASDLSNKADKSQITDLQNQISELKDNQFEVQTFSDEDSGKTWEAQKAGHRLAVIEN